MHRGVICWFPFRWIDNYGSNKSTRKETGETHLCAVITHIQGAVRVGETKGRRAVVGLPELLEANPLTSKDLLFLRAPLDFRSKGIEIEL